MHDSRSRSRPRSLSLKTLLPVAACLLGLAAPAAAIPVPAALDGRNVADDGTASLVAGAVTDVTHANDTEFSGDAAFNMLNVSSAVLDISIALAAPTLLVELAALVDPPDDINQGSDPNKGTNAVEFLISTNNGGTYTSLGTVGFAGFTTGALGPPGNFALASITGSWSGVTDVRYRFTPEDDNGQRIAEVLALQVPEPSTLSAAMLGFALVRTSRRRRTDTAPSPG